MSAESLKEESKRIAESVDAAKETSGSPSTPTKVDALLEMTKRMHEIFAESKAACESVGTVNSVEHELGWFIDAEDELNELHTLLASRGVADAKPNWRESAWAAAMVESILNERDAIAKNRDDWRTFSDNAMPLLVAAKRDLATLAVMLIVTFVLLMAAVVRLCCLTSEGVGVRKTAIVPVQTPVPLVAPAVFAPPIPPVVVIRQQSALQPFILTAQPRKEPRR